MMKKGFLLVILVLVLVAALPIGALAAKPQEFEVSVHNRTGAPAQVKVSGADGVPVLFTVPAGFSTVTLGEGYNDYWVSSVCGNSAGSWNLNIKKSMWIDCTGLGNKAWLAGKPEKLNSCSDYGYAVSWGGYVEFNSETYWNGVISWEENVAYLVGNSVPMVYGCVTDLVWNGYYNGQS